MDLLTSSEKTGCYMYHSQGAHLETRDGVAGTRFGVWAPNAKEVSVLCDANGWTPGRNYLNGSDSGVWTGFVPGVEHGATYKFGIRTREGALLEKSDPVAFAAEHPPKTASIVYDLAGHEWGDGNWLEHRKTTNWLEQPIAVYEVHLGSWRRPKDGRKYP